MKKQEIVIIIASVALVLTIVFFGFNLIKSNKKEVDSNNSLVSKHWNKDKNVNEIVCTKYTDKDINGNEVKFLNRIEYHIQYNKKNNDKNLILNEFYQYYLVYPTGLEYQANHSFVIEEEIGDVEHFDKFLTNVDTHYLIKPSDFMYDDPVSKEAEEAYNRYLELLKNPYPNEVDKLKKEGYTCE